MRSNLERLTTIVLIVVLACLSMRFSAIADDQDKTPATGDSAARIALLDVGRAFKESTAFQAEMQAIQADLTESQRGFTNQNEALAVIIAEHKQLTPGTKDYLDLEEQIATEQAKLKAQIARRKAQAVSQEAEAYAGHYELLQEVVDKYARQHEVQLVLRHNTAAMNPGEPKSVLSGINRFVVFEDQLDITETVLQLINSN